MNDATPVLLYDGECGLCARSVQFVLQHEAESRRSRLRFAPLEGTFGTAVRTSHPHVAHVDSVIWYEPTTTQVQLEGPAIVRMRGDAALSVLRHLGGGWTWVARLGALVPRVLRDALYNLVARHRIDLAPRACVLPTPAQQHRFLP